MDKFGIAVVAYILTGVALTGYDFSAPALHKKLYVIQRNYGAAVRNVFMWPLTAGFEAYQEYRLRRNATRFLLGVVLLAGGLFLWSRFAYLLTLRIIDSEWGALAVATLLGLFLCPIVTAIAMPHRS